MCIGKFFHTWDKWKVTEKVPLFKNNPITNHSYEAGIVIEQQRECKVCGLTQIRQDTTSL